MAIVHDSEEVTSNISFQKLFKFPVLNFVIFLNKLHRYKFRAY